MLDIVYHAVSLDVSPTRQELEKTTLAQFCEIYADCKLSGATLRLYAEKFARSSVIVPFKKFELKSSQAKETADAIIQSLLNSTNGKNRIFNQRGEHIRGNCSSIHAKFIALLYGEFNALNSRVITSEFVIGHKNAMPTNVNINIVCIHLVGEEGIDAANFATYETAREQLYVFSIPPAEADPGNDRYGHFVSGFVENDTLTMIESNEKHLDYKSNKTIQSFMTNMNIKHLEIVFKGQQVYGSCVIASYRNLLYKLLLPKYC